MDRVRSGWFVIQSQNTQAGILAAEYLIGQECEELVFASPTQTLRGPHRHYFR